jgi:hypothetical protein
MKCSNPNCSHRIGLVSYQRGWFDKRRFCSKRCQDDFTAARPRPSQQERLILALDSPVAQLPSVKNHGVTCRREMFHLLPVVHTLAKATVLNF